MTLRFPYQAIRFGLIFGCSHIAGTSLDSSTLARQIPTCQFWPTKSARGGTDNTETDIVVAVAGIVVVAVRRTAVPWIVVPGAAALARLVPMP